MDTVKRLQLYIGIGLLVISIALFLFSFVSSIPSDTTVTQSAKALPKIPSNLFSAENGVVKSLNKLNVPANVPVVVDPATLGRPNIFQNF